MAEIQISTRLTGFQRAAKSVNRLGDSFKRMGNKVRAASRVFVTRILPAIAAAGAAILALGNKFRTAFRDIAVSTGAIGKKLDGLKADFKAILKTGPDSFKAVADAVGTLNTLLALTGKPLQRLSRQILDMSRLLGEDAAQNTRLFAKAINQFSEPVENAGVVLDQLFVITQRTGIAFGELLNQVLRQGPAFGPLNASLIQVADLMGRFNKAGIRARSLGPGLLAFFAKAGKSSKKMGAGLRDAAGGASIAATSFRSLTSSTRSLLERSRALAAGIGQTSEGFNKVADATTKAMQGLDRAAKTPIQAFDAIIKKIAGTTDKLRQMTIASEAFGVDAAGAIVTAINKGILKSFDDLGKGLDKAAGGIRKITDETRTLGDVMGTFGNDVAVAFGPLGLAFDKLARDSVPALKTFSTGLGEFLAFLVEFASRSSAALGTAFDAISPIRIGIMLNETFPIWKAFIEGLIALFGQLAAAVGEKFSQIGAIIGEALASLLKIDFGAAIAKTLNFITESFKVWGANVVSIVGDTVKGIRSWLVDRFNAIVASIIRAINRMVDAFRRARRALSSGSIVPDMVSEIGKEFKKLDNTMVAVTARQTGQVISNFQRMNNAIAETQARAIRAGASALKVGGTVTGKFRQAVPLFRVSAIRTKGSFQTGGSRVFTTPSLINVAEHGAERLTAEPLGGARRGRSGNTFVFEGPVMFDELSLQKFGREVDRVLSREARRTV